MVGENIKLKTKELLNAFMAMTRIGNVQMQPKSAYWLARNFKEIQKAYQDYTKNLAAMLMANGGSEDRATHVIQVPPTVEIDGEDKPNPDLEKAQAAHEKLLESEVEITINIISLSGILGNISPADINAIEFMINPEESQIMVFPGGRLKQ